MRPAILFSAFCSNIVPSEQLSEGVRARVQMGGGGRVEKPSLPARASIAPLIALAVCRARLRLSVLFCWLLLRR